MECNWNIHICGSRYSNCASLIALATTAGGDAMPSSSRAKTVSSVSSAVISIALSQRLAFWSPVVWRWRCESARRPHNVVVSASVSEARGQHCSQDWWRRGSKRGCARCDVFLSYSCDSLMHLKIEVHASIHSFIHSFINSFIHSSIS